MDQPDQEMLTPYENEILREMDETKLRISLIGRKLSEVPTPSVVLDLNQVTVNCVRMLEAAKNLSLQWRAHIKTHKVKSSSSSSFPSVKERRLTMVKWL